MTKEQIQYKAIILADLRITYRLCTSSIKADRLLAAYHAQQAIEKTIKLEAALLGINLWGHNIAKLINDCKRYNIFKNMHIPKEIISNADMYSSWESECRYYPVKVVRSDSILKAYRLCNDYLDKIC